MNQEQINAVLLVVLPLISALTAYLTFKTQRLDVTAKIHDVQLNGPTHVQDSRIAAVERTAIENAAAMAVAAAALAKTREQTLASEIKTPV